MTAVVPGRELEAAVPQHEAPAHMAPREIAPAAMSDFDATPPIASPFHVPAAVEATLPLAVAPIVAKPEPKPEPQHAPRPVQAPRPIPELPPVSLTLPPESGLELVETKIKAAPMAEPEPSAPAGPRRVRPPKFAVVDEPLQIVETQRTQLPPTS